jgi:hypothetical protein
MKYVVDFHDDVTLDEINSHLSSLGGTILKTYNFSTKTFLVEFAQEPALDSEFHKHLVNDEASPLQLLSTTVIAHQPDLSTWPQLTISTSDPKDWWKNFVLNSPNFDVPTFDIPRMGQNNVVYILDSGIKLDHPDFVGRPVSCIFSFNNDMTDYNGHGTALASVVTGITCGITESTVKAVKIFQDGVPTLQSDMLNAFDAIYQDFMNSPQEYAVVNCSWSISKNSLIENKINELVSNGLYFVCAAGNSGLPIENVTPAGMDSVITVGSFDEDLNPCSFSDYTGDLYTSPGDTNHGELNGWAPGKNIYIATLNGTFGYMSGTSISSAIQAAVVSADLEMATFDDALAEHNRSAEDFEFTGIDHNYHLNHMKKISLSRKDMLNLSDPKYANSENRICTLYTKLNTDSGFKIQFFGLAHTGNKYGSKIFYPAFTDRLEILTDLPDGVTIKPNGILVGIPPVVTEPLVQKFQMVAYDKEGTSHEFEYKLITLPSNYVINRDTPEEDEELNILLLANPCKPSSCEPCYENCPWTYCKFKSSGAPVCGKPGFICQCD